MHLLISIGKVVNHSCTRSESVQLPPRCCCLRVNAHDFLIIQALCISHRRHRNARSPNIVRTLPSSKSILLSQLFPASTSGAVNLTTTQPRTEAADHRTLSSTSCRCLTRRRATAGSMSSSPSPQSLPLSHFLPPMRGKSLNSSMKNSPSDRMSGPNRISVPKTA